MDISILSFLLSLNQTLSVEIYISYLKQRPLKKDQPLRAEISEKSLKIKICLPLAEQNRNQASDEIFRISAGVTNICLFVKAFEKNQ